MKAKLLRKLRKRAEFKFREYIIPEEYNDGIWMMKMDGKITQDHILLNLVENAMVDILGSVKTMKLFLAHEERKKQRRLLRIWKLIK